MLGGNLLRHRTRGTSGGMPLFNTCCFHPVWRRIYVTFNFFMIRELGDVMVKHSQKTSDREPYPGAPKSLHTQGHSHTAFTNSLTHLLTHSLTHSLIHSLTAHRQRSTDPLFIQVRDGDAGKLMPPTPCKRWCTNIVATLTRLRY